MADYFYSVARIEGGDPSGEFGWQVLQHDGKQVLPASEVFSTSAEARAEAERLVSRQKATDA